MADFEYMTYNYNENSGFWGATQQVTWHMDRFRDKHEEMMSAQTIMIETKFDALIKGLKDIFTGKQEGTDNDESYYDMVQRESSETQLLHKNESDESQSAFTNYSNMLKGEMDETQSAINNNTTKVFGAISSNTESTANAINGQTNDIKNSTLKTNVQNWPDWNN